MVIGDSELVQKRSLNILDYKDQFRKLKLISLKDRLLRDDLIEMLKMQKSFEKIALAKSSLLIKHTVPTAAAMCNALRFLIESFIARLSNVFSQNVTVRHNFFLNRVVPVRSSVPDDVVSFLTVKSLKNALDRHYKIFG